MTYTRGPWISENDVQGKPPDAGCGVIASDDDIKISNPSRGIIAWANRSVNRTNEETLANARLIAASPDLLEALKLLHANIAEYARINNLGGFDNHDMKMARAAIAKAEKDTGE